ncbi:hypothetical protein [Weissella sp. MSCH1]|uniref:hypothetical protein n=1 Tax=Weissella sp. MSCH1 TaxID=3383343 RepID=UPI003896854C
MLTVDNWISITGIALPIVVSAVTFIWKSFMDAKVRDEQARPNVFISYERGWQNGNYMEELVLKNYGQTTAIITNMKISPAFESNGDAKVAGSPFEGMKGVPLAPGQEMRTLVGHSNGQGNDNTIKREKRHFVIEYRNPFFNKDYSSDYYVNEPGLPVMYGIGTGKNVVEVKLNQSQFVDLKKSLKFNKVQIDELDGANK